MSDTDRFVTDERNLIVYVEAKGLARVASDQVLGHNGNRIYTSLHMTNTKWPAVFTISRRTSSPLWVSNYSWNDISSSPTDTRNTSADFWYSN